MRKLKFRAWLKGEKKMVEVEAINFNGCIMAENWHKFDFETIELMQFTGLKDRDGKEIYEGDIITAGIVGEMYSAKQRKHIVEYIDRQGCFCGKTHIVKREYFVPLREMYDVEIIGNIYENADLLEEENEV